ncbi:MAG: hypothetical protein Q9219_002896 [cf. Caloplaca sp. 3 TL-2023]
MRIKKNDADHVRTWMDLNPEYRYELLTDGSAETYVQDNFPDRIAEIYTGINDFILRADLIRYLVLLNQGGVYADLDVACVKPIDLWIPSKLRPNSSVVLGVEVDNDYGPNRSKQFELVNWTIMARRNQPFMQYLVDRVIENLEKAATKHNTTLAQLKPQRQEVIDVTGPMALTRAAFEYLSDATKTTVTTQNFTKMKRPQLMADILILPINAFGAGHQVTWSGADEDGSALVHHHFAGSWKTNHFDGPTQEEKKAAEEKAKAEEEKKNEEKAKEEARKKKEAEEKKKQEAQKQEGQGRNATTPSNAADGSTNGNEGNGKIKVEAQKDKVGTAQTAHNEET